jgi:hypothetical protein
VRCARLPELAESREERESHDVLLGVIGLCRSFRASVGSQLSEEDNVTSLAGVRIVIT